MDDNIETNVSTFAAEMREIAFILRNIDRRSLCVNLRDITFMNFVLTTAKGYR
jgi:hypothetical protein